MQGRLQVRFLSAKPIINMVMYYKKLNRTFDFREYKRSTAIISYGNSVYYQIISETDRETIFSVIPENYRKLFFLCETVVTSPLLPHIDNGIKTNINFYISTGNCRTTFYKIKNYNPSPTQGTGSMFRYKDVESIDSFVALPGEAYLINVSIPHSVNPVINTSRAIHRHALSLQTSNLGFDDVLDMLSSTNSV
jgi:hypothetical protein